ncbi:MAG: septal ring lytic transglycosylase RlpA family protein [Acidobacteria bacterium]|nr:septal ring lytic transglycosylase RlpA family protein [Acidobacteriota bacterium]
MDTGRGSGCYKNPKRFRVALLVFGAVIIVGLSACGRKASPKIPSGSLTGKASWYGEKFHNKRTASGEKFNMRKLTAAHRTLPFNTIVRVENLKNGRKVDVRINDRGPFVEGRIIDLSRKAAEKLDMIRDGVVTVRLEVLK